MATELVPPVGDHRYMNGAVPPVGVTVPDPFAERQVAGVVAVGTVNPTEDVIVAVPVIVPQMLLPTVTV